MSWTQRFPEAAWQTEAPTGYPTAFIQWKGTDVCMDVVCLQCRAALHFDGMFAHYVRCEDCGAVMQMKALVEYRLLPSGATPHIEPMSHKADENGVNNG